MWGPLHPNIITLAAGSPVFLTTLHYLKCKCGGIFNHKKTCNFLENGTINYMKNTENKA